MSYEGWYSKKDVIADLTTASGNIVGDFDDRVIVGEHPPPRNYTHEVDESEVLRLCGRKVSVQGADSNRKPDLDGIMEMLRMVDDFHEKPLRQSDEKIDSSGVTSNVTVVITKLNPNSAEFVPKNYAAIDNNKHIDQSISKENKEQSGSSSSSTNTKKTDFTNLQNCTEFELRKIKEKLKTQIGDMAQTKCVKQKRERNIAITTLLKLNCHPPPESNKPKLIAPDYFTKKLCDHTSIANDISSVNKPEPIIDEKSERNGEKVTNDLDNISIERKTRQESIQPARRIETPSDNTNDKRDQDVDISKEIKESIQKVENWLHSSPAKKTKSPLYLGPVIFKKKETKVSKSASPISVDSDIRSNKDNFIPSSYADELTKKYIERNKKNENIENDMWTQLELQLKAKDEIIKNQRLQVIHSSQ